MTNQSSESSNESPNTAPINGGANDSGGENEPTGASAGKELERLTSECSELKDRLLRHAADSENQRKRFEREKSELYKFATESLLKDLVPVLDSFEQAAPELASQTDDEAAASSFRSGFQMVKKQLLTVLKKHGLESIEAVGQPFDPNVHQAIQRIEDANVKSDTVYQEFAKGFTLNGRLLRASMVSVKVPNT